MNAVSADDKISRNLDADCGYTKVEEIVDQRVEELPVGIQ